MEEKEHVLDILIRAENAVKKSDTAELRELSNQTIHSASIHQDTVSISVAVIVYSLSKIVERSYYKGYSGWKIFLDFFINHLENAINFLQKNDEKMFLQELQKVHEDIDKLSGKLKIHIQDVFRKASINKASRIYEHGISMEKTAKLLGLTVFELAEYAGQTRIPDVDLNLTLPVKQRVKYALEMFT